MSAMRQLLLVLVLLCVVSSIAAISFERVDPKCTILCINYWSTTLTIGNAKWPSGCECSKFAI
uniref:AAI domain-containing protein n=1 Tax=Ascaris lumbricoides TaxID=6252 RepID=A0A0M3HYC6_ASCLU